MLKPSLDSLMDLWVDHGNAAVATRLNAPSTHAGMRHFKKHYLFPYAYKVQGKTPYTNKDYQRLKEHWRKERAKVEDLV